jgi:hypothetical protein
VALGDTWVAKGEMGGRGDDWLREMGDQAKLVAKGEGWLREIHGWLREIDGSGR